MLDLSYFRSVCRACGTGALKPVLDLGHTPLANTLMPTEAEARALPKYPLCMCVCADCMMVQLNVAIPSEVLFSHYVYETPRAASLEAHYGKLVEKIVKMRGEFATVFEMGSNNGTFLEALGERVTVKMGIEPASNLAAMANQRGLFTLVDFFSPATVKRIIAEYGTCDVLVARHCMAHLDDLRGTLGAIADVLVDGGVAVIENAYLLDTVRGTQFDQIYHEHMSYFAVTPIRKMLACVGLTLTHVMHSPVHGGSIVLFATKGKAEADETVIDFMTAEAPLLHDLETFAFRARACIAGVREGMRYLSTQKRFISRLTGTDVNTVDSYGATAKGNTLMNVIGLEQCPIRYAVDSTPSKQGLYLPGTGVKVISEEQAAEDRPDFYLLTAWNYEREILAKQSDFRGQGGRFIVPLPYPRLVLASPRMHRLLLLAAASDVTFEESSVGLTGRCIHCKTKVSLTSEGRSVDATVEHIVPKTHGGTDDLENLAIACRRCNEGKGRRLDSRRFTDPTLQSVIATLRQRRTVRLRDPAEILARLGAR